MTATEANRPAGVCPECRHSLAWHVLVEFRGTVLLVCELPRGRTSEDGTHYESDGSLPCTCSLPAEAGWPELVRPLIPEGAGHSWDDAMAEGRREMAVQCGRCDGRGNTQWGPCFACFDGVVWTDRLIVRDTARRTEGFHRNRGATG